METLVEKIWQQVANITGYDPEALDPDMRLDVDLGIDSLKTMSLWNSVMSVLSDDARNLGRSRQADMMGINTLGTLRDFLVDLSVAAQSPALAGQTHVAVQQKSYVSEVDPGGEQLPIAHAQRLFLLSHQLVNSTALCSMVRVQGELDTQHLQQAWQALVDRHISLRTCFYIPQGCSSMMDIEYRLLPDCKVPALTAHAVTEADIENTFFAQLNREWDIRQWPLHEFSLHQISDLDHVIMLANEHIISDGLGNQRMLRELLEIYAQLQAGSFNDTATFSLGDYVREVTAINNYRDQEEIAHYSQYNRSLGKETCIWNPNQSIGSDRRNHFKNIVHQFSTAQTQRLLNIAKDKRYAVYSLLLSLWLRSLSSHIRERDSFILQMPTSGTVYPDCELDQTIGCWAQNMALKFSAVTDVDAAVAGVDDQLQTAIAQGFDRAQTCLMADAYAQDFPLENGIVPDFALAQAQASMRANLYFPYTGRTRIEQTYADLQVTDYRAGTCNVAGTIDVLQEIHQGRLTLFANYDSLHFTGEQIAELVQVYTAQVEQWLAQQETGKATAIDHAKTADHIAIQAQQAVQDWQEFVLKQAQQILTVAVSTVDLERDLEAEVGVDSLERIRLATQISKSLNNKTISRQLIRCRSLAEIVALLQSTQAIAEASKNAVAQPDHAIVKADHNNSPAKNFPVLDSSLGLVPVRYIEQQAALHPQVEAVCNQTDSINYQQLNERANQLANLLVAQGVAAGDRVAMLCRRGPNMLTAIVAILKAGAAYVPLDPDFPEQRIEYIINHSQASFLVGESQLLVEKTNSIKLPDSLKGVAQIDQGHVVRPLKAINASWFSAADWKKLSSDNLALAIDPDDLMVVLYTSGSTGKPKGVALNHQGYFNRLNWHQNEFQLQVGERVAQKTSCCFDVSVWELLWPLMVGGTVCAVEKDVVTNPWELADWIKAQKIAVMHFVPSMFTEFTFAAATEKLELPDLRWLIFSGEALPVATVQAWIDAQGLDIGLANLYGPTEASIDVTSHIIRTRPDANAARISIGAAIDNTVMLILDDNNQRITSLDQMGDLYIAGIQLAKGYLFDDEKTKAAFIPNPFSDVPGEFIYKTGDIACWLPEGEIDYRGRKDSQVKLRGFRIELGEIESVLTGHCGAIEAAALVVDVNGQQKLLACYSPANLAAPSVKKLAAEKLTEYMVPHIWVGVDALPKNHNGKLDRNLVRELFEQGKLQVTQEKPVEQKHAPAPTARSLSSQSLSYGLTPAQLQLVQSVSAPYLRASCTRMRYQGKLDADLMCQALDIQVQRHDALRSIFVQENNCWQRKAVAQTDYEPQFFDARGLNAEQLDDNFCRLLQSAADSLRIDTWPLMQVMLVRVEAELYEIGIVCHQIIGDMVTGNLMCQQLWQTYDQLANGQAVNRDAIPSGLDLAQRLEQKEQELSRAALVDYWQREFAQPNWPFAIAHSKTGGANTYGNQANVYRELNAEQSQELLNGVHQKLGVSSYALFAGPLYKTMAEKAQRERVVISHRFNGRNAIRERIYFESIDGFAIQFPIALAVNSEQNAQQLAQNFEKTLAAVPWRGASYDWVGMDLPNYVYPESRVTAVRMNFLGDMTRPENSKIQLITGQNNLRLVPEDHIRPIDIEIWVMIKDGKVGVEVGYSSQQFHERDIATLLETYLSELRKLARSVSSNPTFTKENHNVAA